MADLEPHGGNLFGFRSRIIGQFLRLQAPIVWLHRSGPNDGCWTGQNDDWTAAHRDSACPGLKRLQNIMVMASNLLIKLITVIVL